MPDDGNQSTYSKFPQFLKVTVKCEDLHISEATVIGYQFKENKLWYEVTTSTSTYTFPEENVYAFEGASTVSRNYRQNVQYAQQYSNRDDVSVNSSVANEAQPRRRYNNHHQSSSTTLLHNQFRIGNQHDIITIQTNNMLRFGSQWEITWKNPEDDPRDFYESLRARVVHYGIYLKRYMDLTKEDSACSLDRSTCVNYDNAYIEMSQSLYTILSTFRSKWFGTNHKLEVLLNYEDDMDGFKTLKAIIKDHHIKLKDMDKCQSMDKPQLTSFPTWFGYMKAYRQWIDFKKAVNREYTNVEHVSNILKLIEDHEAFDLAKQTLKVEIAKFSQNLIPFPPKFTLKQIGITINELLPEHAQSVLPTYQAPVQGTINKVNTRSNQKKPSFQHQHDNDEKEDSSNRQWYDLICSACGVAGHDIAVNGCDNMAIKKNLEGYERGKNKFNTKEVKEIFEQHQIGRKDKRKSGKSQRNILRRRLRKAKQEFCDKSKYNDAKNYYIRVFKEQNPEYDLNDPRQDHNLEVREYDILESEDESVSTEEV